jgi:hypothetical protein
MAVAPVTLPTEWNGTEYRPSALVRRRARLAALALGPGAFSLAVLSLQIVLIRFPYLPNYPDGRTALLFFTALVFAGAGVSLFCSLWLFRLAESALTVAREGILYRDHLGLCWTPWENVRRYENPGIPLVWWDGLCLYDPPYAIYARYGWWLARVQPHWLRREEPFIPLNPLAPFWRDGAVLRDLRANAPWIFAEEG